MKKIIIENFPILERGKTTQVQEAQWVPNKMNPNRPTPRYIIIKMPNLKDKENILKAAREKQEVYKGTPITLAADFSTDTVKARREWQKIFQVMRSKGFQANSLPSEDLN